MAMASAAQLSQVSALYVALFNRAPDTAGLSFWSNALANGASIATITSGFLGSPEGTSNYPAVQDGSAFIGAFYTKAFGRAPDASGLAYWISELGKAGGVASDAAKAYIVQQIIYVVGLPLASRPAEFTEAQYQQTLNDRALFANKVDAGMYVASQTSLSEAGAKLVLYGPGPSFTPVITTDYGTVLTAKSNVVSAAVDAAVSGNIPYVGSQYNDVFKISVAKLVAATTFSLDGGAGGRPAAVDQ